MTKLTVSLAALVAALGALALVLANRTAGAQVPSAAGSASSADRKRAPPPPLRGSDIPTEASKPPTAAEWKTGRAVSIEGLTDCNAKLLREYLRVSCEGLIGVGLVAGEPKDVRAWVSGTFGYDMNTNAPGTPVAMVDLPLRRGQGYLVNFNSVGGGDYVATWGNGGYLIVSWREGDADPLVVRPNRFD